MKCDERTKSHIHHEDAAENFWIIGVIILALGMISAGIVYWMGTRSADLSDDLLMAGYDKPETRQMEILYGKEGELIEDWSNDLKQPGTQAFIIVLSAAVIAGGCLFLLDCPEDDAGEMQP